MEIVQCSSHFGLQTEFVYTTCRGPLMCAVVKRSNYSAWGEKWLHALLCGGGVLWLQAHVALFCAQVMRLVVLRVLFGWGYAGYL